jgi:TP901 family phage tail tape measure protein
MADEVLNKLGFDVSQALDALAKLDGALQGIAGALSSSGAAMSAWNSKAEQTVAILRDMASQAGRAASAMARINASAAATPTPAAATTPSKLWLPPDYSAATSSVNAYAQASKAAGAAATATGVAATTAGKSAATSAQQAAAATNSMTASWGTLGRVVMTQMIVRVLSQIRDALREAISESLKFQRSIAEIQTIAPKIDQNFASLGREVSTFARQFNFPLPQAAEALYQTISDQFTTVKERTDIMTAAAKLAKVGVMELNDAAQLLTGALNAYGMASSQAEDVAAKFFKTIELGRMRGAELTPVLGRIIPIASQLGVSLDEVNASMISLTIGSAKVPEAATQVRSALAALVKPSTDLQRELRVLGYDTGQQLVHAKGLQGALELLRNSVDGDVAATATMFRNIRALNAELRLTGTGAKQAEEGLRALATTSREDLNKAFVQFTSTDAEQFTKELNKLKIALATDVGPELIKFVSLMLKAAGGADSLAAALKAIVSAVTAFGPPLLAVGAGLAALAMHARLAAANATLLGAALNNAVAPLAFIVAGATFVDQKLANLLEDANANFKKSVQERLAEEEKASEAIIAADQKTYEEAGRRLEEYMALVRRAYNQQVDEARKADEDILASSRVTMQQMIAVREKVAQQLRSLANTANQAADDSMKRQVDLQGRYDDTLFKQRVRQQSSLAGQSEDYQRRAMSLAMEAARELAEAKTPDEAASARAIFQRAQAHAQEAESIAQSAKDSWAKEGAERVILSVIQQQIEAERTFTANKREQASEALKAAAAEQQRIDRMKVLLKGIMEDLTLFDKKGPIDSAKQAQKADDLKTKMSELRGLWTAGKQIDVGEMLKFDQLQRRVQGAVEGGISVVEVQKLFAAPAAIDALRHQIQSGLGAVEIAMKPFIGGKITQEMLAGKTPSEQTQVITREYQKQVDLVGKLQREQAAIAQSTIAQKAAMGALGANLSIYKTAMGDWRTFMAEMTKKGVGTILGGGDVEASTRALSQLYEVFEKLSKTGAKGFGMDEFLKLQKTATEALKSPSLTAFDKKFIESQMGWLKTLADEAERMKKIQGPAGKRDVSAEMKAAEAEAARLQMIIDQLQPQTSALGEGAMDAQAALSAMPDMSGLTGQIRAAANAMWDLAYASMSVQSPSTEMVAAHGGKAWSFLAFGGPPQGTDVIPAMLSPGEVVINAESARRFSAQLTAMNAGVQPVFRSDGGSVTNIGDINVSVTGGGSSRQTARSIATELRRELRRGTSTL